MKAALHCLVSRSEVAKMLILAQAEHEGLHADEIAVVRHDLEHNRALLEPGRHSVSTGCRQFEFEVPG